MGSTIEDPVIAEGDKIAHRWTLGVTHQGEVMGATPTGRAVEVAGIYVVRIVGGKILEVWGVWNALGLMRQLDAISELTP